MKRYIAAFVLASMLVLSLALAEPLEPSGDLWVQDQANVLSEETEGLIFFSNQRMAESASGEVVVVTVDTTGDVDIGDFAYALFNDWDINAQGALVLLAIRDEDYYTIPGALLGESLSSAEITAMYDEYLEDDFAAGNYDAGVRRFFTALFDRVAEIEGVSVRAADGAADYEAWKAQYGQQEEPAPTPEATPEAGLETPAPVPTPTAETHRI
ncbi:MAG: TPM domain-containing protein [Clostridiales bacterium]|nr:TPM domain-containing protein [Clostridiales bacterium]